MSKTAEYCEVDDYWPKDRPAQTRELLERIAPRKFHDMMDDRMLVSFYKYGDSSTGYPEKSIAMDNIQVRVDLYKKTGNVEYLIDAANFCMLEFMHPSIKDAFLKATDADGSPGMLYRDGTFSSGKHTEKE